MEHGGDGMNIVWPDFLNLGIAPHKSRGAMAFAPRLKLVPPATYGQIIPRNGVRANTPLTINQFALLLNPVIPGQPWNPVQLMPLIPNPYTGNQGS